MPNAQQTQITCHKGGFFNHLTTNCTIRGNHRVMEHKIHSIKIQKSIYAAQASNAQTHIESPVDEIRLML